MGERCGLQERMTKGTYSGQRTLHTLYIIKNKKERSEHLSWGSTSW